MRPDRFPSRRTAACLREIALAALAAVAGVIPSQVDAADVYRTGTLRVSANVAIVSAIAQSDPISASVEITTFDAVSTNSQSILLDTNVTRTGNTATFTVAIPYRFILDSTRAASAKLTATVTLYFDNTQAYASSGPVSIPATGVTTPVTVQLAL